MVLHICINSNLDSDFEIDVNTSSYNILADGNTLSHNSLADASTSSYNGLETSSDAPKVQKDLAALQENNSMYIQYRLFSLIFICHFKITLFVKPS